MGPAFLGDFGTHLIAKNKTIGAWAAMRSCQMWAAAPSSAWGAGPCKATKINTVARAPRDIATGRKALGRFITVDVFISPPYGFAVGVGTQYYDKTLCGREQPGIFEALRTALTSSRSQKFTDSPIDSSEDEFFVYDRAFL